MPGEKRAHLLYLYDELRLKECTVDVSVQLRLNQQKRVCDERQRCEVCFEWVRLLKAPFSFYLLFIDLFICDLRPNLFGPSMKSGNDYSKPKHPPCFY